MPPHQEGELAPWRLHAARVLAFEQERTSQAAAQEAERCAGASYGWGRAATEPDLATDAHPKSPDEGRPFATTGAVADVPFAMCTALTVEGLEGGPCLQLPARPDQLAALLVAGVPAAAAQPARGRGRAAGAAARSGKAGTSAAQAGAQIDGARVAAVPVFEVLVRGLLPGVLVELGLDAELPVQAQLQQLLVHSQGSGTPGDGHVLGCGEEGSEKEAGVFGTLALQLPVAGGHTVRAVRRQLGV